MPPRGDRSPDPPRAGPGVPRPLAREADRERLVALLREHYAQGQLSIEELDRRVGAVLGARYLDEVASAIADLPQLAGAGDAGAGSRNRPAKRRRGHAQAAQPAAGWVPTQERFRDPTTRAVIRVWVDPADQSRHYVPEPDA